MYIFAAIYVLSFLAFIVHYLKVRPISFAKTIELLFLYQLVFNIGCLGILSFIGLTFMPERAAQELGWTMCHFQQELANVNLGYGVVGFLCIWFRGLFWTSTTISASIWLFGDGLQHLYNNFWGHDFNLLGTGIIFFTDLFIPIALMTLLFFYHRTHIIKAKVAEV